MLIFQIVERLVADYIRSAAQGSAIDGEPVIEGRSIVNRVPDQCIIVYAQEAGGMDEMSVELGVVEVKFAISVSTEIGRRRAEDEMQAHNDKVGFVLELMQKQSDMRARWNAGPNRLNSVQNFTFYGLRFEMDEVMHEDNIRQDVLSWFVVCQDRD